MGYGRSAILMHDQEKGPRKRAKNAEAERRPSCCRLSGQRIYRVTLEYGFFRPDRGRSRRQRFLGIGGPNLSSGGSALPAWSQALKKFGEERPLVQTERGNDQARSQLRSDPQSKPTFPGMTQLCRFHKTQNVDQFDQRAGRVVQPCILCTDIGQSPVLHSHLASNLLESASARREDTPPCAAQ